MSEQEGTPKKVPRLATNDGEENGSGRRSAPSTPSRHAYNRDAPSTPSRLGRNSPSSPFRLADRSTPSSPFRQADRSAPSTPAKFVDNRSAPPSPFRQFDRSAPSTPRRAENRSAPPSPLRLADDRNAPSTAFKFAHSTSAPSTPTRKFDKNNPFTHQPEDHPSATPLDFKSTPASPNKFLTVAGNEPPAALSIIIEDVDMEDDKAGPSQLQDSPESPFLSTAIGELPRSPLTKWFQELGAGLNSLSNSLLGCVKPSEAEKYEWVCSLRYKPFGGDEKWLGQVYRDDPPHRTHLLGAAIPDIHCFEVSTRKLQQLPAEVTEKLGACVTFPRQLFSACQVDGCFRCSLYNCNACPHQYLCNCIAKEEYNGGEWCAHIHVAYARNMDVYGAEACLFIQEGYTNLTEKRHIRAMIQGPNKMCKVEPNLYMENFEYLVRSVRYNVKVNASKIPKSKCICTESKKCIHCDACWCRYSCTCEDYWFDRQVCEHVHNVAMQEQEEISLDKQFSFQHFTKSEMIFRDKPSIIHQIRERSMMAEHELSYHIPFKYVEEIEEGQTWRLASARDRRVATVSVNKQWQSSCVCKIPTTTKARMCVVCNICTFHYTCDCIHAEEVSVCRHMHAVARYRQLELADEDTYLTYKLEYYGKLMSEFEKKQRFTENMLTRRPTGVTKSCSETPTPTSSSASSYTSALVDMEN